ncbi:hypothetical protein DACRYDRAFT_107046 [Dacryopinax primogenitus]|uniref:Uncharacterized protein n=1 Tax=Dacryopinax primogenitus (strain DJM 731) TaxID=1858805 RepID=M5FW53_DACPD|nr:uncharacterized protein DACRYDRAFT_107046 [Dacryopinax primogenitus]EJU02101.1 hypothetical protein DACRYDRAFT_107046 [Dacryopinax primogenitus]
MFVIHITTFVSLLALSWLVTAAPVFKTDNQQLATVEARSFDNLDLGYGVRHLQDRDLDLHNEDDLQKRETDEDSSWMELRSDRDDLQRQLEAEHQAAVRSARRTQERELRAARRAVAISRVIGKVQDFCRAATCRPPREGRPGIGKATNGFGMLQ